MRYGIWALVALVIGAFGAHFLLQDRGYVLISFAGYNIEMSVPVLALALVLLYLAVRLALRLWRAPRQLGEAIASSRSKRAGARLTRGLIHMTEGDYRRGERLLTDGLQGSDAKVVHYLMAARAAEAQGSVERRDEWLELARTSDPKAGIAVLLTQAELQIDAGEIAAAQATLKRIEAEKPDHAGGLGLQADIYLATGNRQGLAEILPRLVKSKLPADRLARILSRALDEMRRHPDFDRAALNAVWSPLPMGLSRRASLIRARALLLDRLGYGEEAVKSLTSALRRSFDSELVAAFGEVKGADLLKQLKKAESWLRQHPEDPALLMTAARLSMANELWGKARSYLESGIALKPEPAAYAVYGELLDRLGEPEAAAKAFQDGLRMIAPDADRLPRLAAPKSKEADG